jgi:pilus assembly protein CpaB
MRLIFGLILLVGMGLAGFAIMTAQNRFAQYQNALAQTEGQIVPVTQMIVMRRSMRYGDMLSPSDVRAVDWPASFVPSGAFTTMEQIFPPGEEGRRTVLRPVERDEPLLQVKVTRPGEEAGLAATLMPGMRAFTLAINVTSGVAGFLRPGDRVDVYWTSGAGGGQTRLIEANLPLIAIDQRTDEDQQGPAALASITIEALPETVAKLAQAQATGSLSLALVGVKDQTASEEGVAATIREVLGAQETAAAPRTCSVRTRRGSEVVMIPVPCPSDDG